MTTIGSLFAGYGGLDMAVRSVLGGDCNLAWYSEINPAASKVLAHHHPGVPNLGNITDIDWASVPPVDILAAGWPCQDISNAGGRAGIEGERSGLWRYVVDAARVLRPRLIVAENVSAVVVRGLDRVLADLAALGFDAEWACVRASDGGAPHRRERFFAVAVPSVAREVSPNPAGDGRDQGRTEPTGQLRGLDVALGGDEPAAHAHGLGSVRARHARGWGNGFADHGQPAADTCGVRQETGDSATVAGGPELAGAGQCADVAWGSYEPAIRRWENILGRPAPEPTEPGRRANRVLSPRFVEWLMGLPAGHVTGVEGLSRNDQLQMLGNGVVPQQAAAALEYLLPLLAAERSAA